MAKVEIYSANNCPYCVKAKALFDRKKVEYTEYNITGDDAARDALVKKSSGLKTVPQIFINDQHYGGADNVYELDAKGELDPILNG